MPAPARCRGRCTTLHLQERKAPPPPITMVARFCDFAIASPFPAFHAGCSGRLPQRLRAHAEQLAPQIRGYDSRDINAPRALTRDTRPRKRLSMRGETIRRDLGERRPGTRPRRSVGPPRETSAHANPCRKTAYARRQTRTPRLCSQGVHSLPAGAPVSRAPLEVADEGWCDERCFRNPETRRPDAVSRHVHERRGLLEAAVAFQMTRPSGSTDCGVADRSSTPARGGSSSPLRIAFRDGSAGSGTILMPRIRCSLNRGPAKGQRHTSYQRDSGPSTRRNNPPSRRISSAVTRPRDGVSPLFSTGGRSPR